MEDCARCRDWGKEERHEDHAALPADLEVSTCARCGREIVWEFDSEYDETVGDYVVNPDETSGFWYDAEHGTEACTPGPNDEDRYHDPRRAD